MRYSQRIEQAFKQIQSNRNYYEKGICFLTKKELDKICLINKVNSDSIIKIARGEVRIIK